MSWRDVLMAIAWIALLGGAVTVLVWYLAMSIGGQ